MKVPTEINWDKASKIFIADRQNIVDRLTLKLDQHPKAKDALLLLAAGGILGISLVSPGAPLVFHSLVKAWRSFNKTHLKQTIWRFRRQKLVEIVGKDDKYLVEITTSGLTKALFYKIEEMETKEPQEWDGKWRMVVFDIADRKKRHREIFRERIKSLGLCKFQESIYVYPYPCFDQVEFLRQVFGVGVEVKYILAEKIEDDEQLRNHFHV